MGEGVSSHPVFTESAGKCAPKNSLTYILKKKPVFYVQVDSKPLVIKAPVCDSIENCLKSFHIHQFIQKLPE